MYVDEPIYYKAYRNTPSVKTMMEYLHISKDDARKIKKILTGKIDLMTIDSARKREEDAYNHHDKITLALEAVNEVMDGFGSEYIESIEDSCYNAEGLEYINMGDTYTNTMMYDYRDQIWRVGTQGDVVEIERKRFGGDDY